MNINLTLGATGSRMFTGFFIRLRLLSIARLALASGLTLMTCLATAQEEDRLLPSSEVAKIKMEWDADLRAINVKLKNEGSLVLTSGQLVCSVRDSKSHPTHASNGLEWCQTDPIEAYSQFLRLKKTQEYCAKAVSHSFHFEETIVPRGARKLYFEVPVDGAPPLRCGLKDLRGRAKKFWEM